MAEKKSTAYEGPIKPERLMTKEEYEKMIKKGTFNAFANNGKPISTKDDLEDALGRKGRK